MISFPPVWVAFLFGVAAGIAGLIFFYWVWDRYYFWRISRQKERKYDGS